MRGLCAGRADVRSGLLKGWRRRSGGEGGSGGNGNGDKRTEAKTEKERAKTRKYERMPRKTDESNS